jgi:hypothetical protein
MANSGLGPRRALKFNDVSEIMPEVRRLQSTHRTLGKWSAAQICKHLTDSFSGSIDGFSLKRHRVKRFLFRRLLYLYTVRCGIPRDYLVDPGIEPADDPDLDEAVEALGRAIARYESQNGPLKPHPLFGRMPRDEWDRIHCIHCAHHLSFVMPGAEEGSPRSQSVR